MLRLICARAGAGKTSYILNEISATVKSNGKKALLLVPEQFSHETEHELALKCGDSLSLYAEVLSFSRLCNRVFTECGGLSDVAPDTASKLVLMSLALKSTAPVLRVYSRQASKSDFVLSILNAREELSSAMIDTRKLLAASERRRGAFGDKLYDMAVICEAYDALLKQRLSDPRSKLLRLRDKIADSGVGNEGCIYIDGFTDFTAEELSIIDELLKKDAEIAVTLCTADDESEVFRLTQKTRLQLSEMAEKRGVKCQIINLSSYESRNKGLLALEQSLFDYTAELQPQIAESVELYAINSAVSECLIAAARIKELLADEPRLKLSDIAVAARVFDKYEAMCESVFENCGLPVFISRGADTLQKPVITLITEAFEILSANWQYSNVFKYIKTGLCGLNRDDCDELENYCLTWNIKGEGMWTRSADWDMNPRGYVTDETDRDRSIAKRADKARRLVSEPLKRLKNAGKTASTAAGQVMALYNFITEIKLPEQLEKKAVQLHSAGELLLASECSQLWDILVSALEQMHETLGELPMGQEEFGKLLTLMLSQYDVSSIPVALDRITLCPLDKVRGKNVKCLVVLGASDGDIPLISSRTGLFSHDELNIMRDEGIELKDSGNMDICREMHMIYAAVCKASQKLIITYPQTGSGGKMRPSFLVSRVSTLSGKLPVSEAQLGEGFMVSSPQSAFQLALSGSGNTAGAARQVLSMVDDWAEKYSAVTERVNAPRGKLNPHMVSALYGKDFNISATRAEKFNSCRFSYFMQYGLRAKPRVRAGFEAPELGTLIHYVLEHVTGEVIELGGFKKVSSSKCAELTRKYLSEYSGKLLYKTQKTSRFTYLFSRLEDSVTRIVLDVAQELASSDFEPLDFELRFADDGDMPPAVIEENGLSMRVSGLVDRADGWVCGDKLYLRVCDYKTGRKEFNLTDVYYGMGIQMLIYLFVLQSHGKERYGKDIVPAGVLYTPTRDLILRLPRNSTDSDIAQARVSELARSGLILDDRRVIEAMENPGADNRIPVTLKNGKAAGSIASAENFGKLARHVERLLADIGEQMRNGNIDADPFMHGTARTACDFCRYTEACQFNENHDKPRKIKTIRRDEFWELIYTP